MLPSNRLKASKEPDELGLVGLFVGLWEATNPFITSLGELEHKRSDWARCGTALVAILSCVSRAFKEGITESEWSYLGCDGLCNAIRFYRPVLPSAYIDKWFPRQRRACIKHQLRSHIQSRAAFLCAYSDEVNSAGFIQGLDSQLSVTELSRISRLISLGRPCRRSNVPHEDKRPLP